MEPFQAALGETLYPWIERAITWSDPITVMVVLVILCLPFTILWTTTTRVIITRIMQPKLNGKNVLVVTSRPSDEAR